MDVEGGRWSVCSKGDLWTLVLHQKQCSLVAWVGQMVFLPLDQPEDKTELTPVIQCEISQFGSLLWLGRGRNGLELLGNDLLGLKWIPGDEVALLKQGQKRGKRSLSSEFVSVPERELLALAFHNTEGCIALFPSHFCCVTLGPHQSFRIQGVFSLIFPASCPVPRGCAESSLLLDYQLLFQSLCR